MRKFLLLLVAFQASFSFAQKNIKPESYASTITTNDLKRHLYIIAGKEMEGRETATEGQRKAAAYIENEFKRIGLQPGNNGSFQQLYPLYQDSLVEARLEVNGQSFQLDKDFNVNVDNLDATLRFSEVVVIGANAMDSMRNADIAGKLVMILPGRSTGANRNMNASVGNLLRSKGVAGILMVSAVYPRNMPAGRKSRLSVNMFRRAYGAQQFTVSENVARAVIRNNYDSLKSATTAVQTYPAQVLLDVKKNTNTLQSSNVIGVLSGTDLKDQYLVITAHYDHEGKRGDSIIYYGADDDGSGTVGVIELAEAFATAKKQGKGPRRSIIFMTVSGEERGLLGSEYYSSNPVYPLDKTTANLNIDMIGRSDSSRKKGDSTNYVYVVGDDKISSELKPVSEAQNKKYTKLELDYKFNDPKDPHRIYYRSDHYNFAKHGVPIIFYYDGMLGADYHKPTDTPEKINYDLLRKRTQLIFYTAWEMANRNEMMKRDLPLPSLSR